MAYNRDNYSRIRQEFSQKHIRAIEQAEAIESEMHIRFPDLMLMDRALAETGAKILDAATKYSGKELDSVLAKLRNENEEMIAQRGMFLEMHGYPADYTSPRYECQKCRDTGYIGLEMCSCMKNALINAGYESSGIGNLIYSQSFETFSPDYHRDDAKAYENINLIFRVCREYAENFPRVSPKNLLFIGATGLGKTHLSTSVAKRLIEREFDVVYETAQNIFSDFEYEHFGRGYANSGEASRTDRYFDCDLLIFDDLGTEMTTQFTVSSLYNIINTRVNRGKATVINTNLPKDELRKRYADRITSRLFGEFRPLMFIGRDVRQKKLEQ